MSVKQCRPWWDVILSESALFAKAVSCDTWDKYSIDPDLLSIHVDKQGSSLFALHIKLENIAFPTVALILAKWYAFHT